LNKLNVRHISTSRIVDTDLEMCHVLRTSLRKFPRSLKSIRPSVV